MESMKLGNILLVGLGILALVLFVRLWTGTGSYPEIWALEQQIDQQRASNEAHAKRNAALVDDVAASRDERATEANARGELGMVKQGETFYQVILQDAPKIRPNEAVPEVKPKPYVE